MLKSLLTIAMLSACLTSVTAAEKQQLKTAATQPVPLPKPSPVKPAPDAGPSISPEDLAKMSPAELQKRNLGTTITKPILGPVEGGKNVAAPITVPEFKPVVAAPPPPLPKGPPIGMPANVKGDIPKGWTECAKTHAAEMCKALMASQAWDKDSKMVIKLPENGSMDDLNKFLDDVAAKKAEMQPQ